MPIPALGDNGYLPEGVHEATLDEVVEVFGSSNTRRRELADKLLKFVAHVRGFAIFTRLFVDGSFCTDVALPGDVDVVLQLPDTKKKAFSGHDRFAELDVGTVKATYEVHLFVEPTEFGNVGWVNFFTRPKEPDLLARKLPPHTRRGILKVRL